MLTNFCKFPNLKLYQSPLKSFVSCYMQTWAERQMSTHAVVNRNTFKPFIADIVHTENKMWDFFGFHSGVSEDSVCLVCDSVSLGE